MNACMYTLQVALRDMHLRGPGAFIGGGEKQSGAAHAAEPVAIASSAPWSLSLP